jgi:hypothetical protein
MTFYPEYETTDRYYSVKFYSWDGSVVLQPYTYTDETGATVTVQKETWEVKYGTVYDGPITNFLYRDRSKLDRLERYGF